MSRHILVTLDSRGCSERLLLRVRLLARHVGCTAHLLSVYPAPCAAATSSGAPEQAARLQAAYRYLHTVATRLRAEGIAVNVEVRCGDPVETILAVARDVGADLITMTIPWLAGDGGSAFGDVTEQVIKKASQPVLVERPHAIGTSLKRGV